MLELARRMVAPYGERVCLHLGEAILAGLSVLAPPEDEALLRDAGFADVGLFYVAGILRGWVCRA